MQFFSVKSQHTLLDCYLLTNFFKHGHLSLTIYFYLFFLIDLYGARVRESVFRIKFRVSSREFESIETSPGFAQLLGENWN